MRPIVVVLALATLLVGFDQQPAHGHAGLVRSDPIAGGSLGATPSAVQLTFSEEPQPDLSTITVLDADGAVRAAGRPEPAAADPHALVVRVPDLERGVYTVTWRVVSAIDGHPSAGTYSFGVGASPGGAAQAASAGNLDPALSEVFGRWLLVLGLVLLLGLAVVSLLGLGIAAERRWLPELAALCSVLGLGLTIETQRSHAAAPLADLLATPVGRALLWRGLAVAIAVAALVLVRRTPRWRRWLMAAMTVAVLAAMGVHVSSGHAAATGPLRDARILNQWVHFVAVGVWIGGLAALLAGVSGAPTAEKATAIRRFSTVALITLLVVAASGTVRAVSEVASWDELIDTRYGQAIVAKVGLVAALAALGALNRWRSVPTAGTDLGRLRRTSTGELGLAAAAVAATALLGALPTPAAARPEPPGIVVSGSDFATTVRATLTAVSSEPGPNRFSVELVDYDSHEPVPADLVSLHFRAPDDPGVAPTTLALEPAPGGTYAAAGANVAFDGRWQVDVLVEHGDSSRVVPLELEVSGPPRFVSIERRPDGPVRYTLQLTETAFVLVYATPARAGPSVVSLSYFDPLAGEIPVEDVVVTSRDLDGERHQATTRRLGAGRFEADVMLHAEHTTVSAVTRSVVSGRRYHISVDLEATER